jgi:carboxylesterase type B
VVIIQQFELQRRQVASRFEQPAIVKPINHKSLRRCHRWLGARLRQALRVTNREILTTSVAVVDHIRRDLGWGGIVVKTRDGDMIALYASEKLPVLVYFFGGGFIAGDGSEGRYDGEGMAKKGIVAVTVNYRLSVFGFFAHPELTKESPHHASGNYALFDQRAALKWVEQNIAVFGGDPKRVTIAGESAGSIAVSAQMASPLSKSLIAGAIGESGSILAWTPEDYKVSQVMQEYFANFVKTGNPNGKGLPNWPKFSEGQRIVIDTNTSAADAEKARVRYEFLDQFYIQK